MEPPPTVAELGEEYVRQIVDLSPGQRKRYLAQVRTITSVEVRRGLAARTARSTGRSRVKEADVGAWLIGWDRSLKTKANYPGLLFRIFAYGVEQGYLAANRAPGRHPSESRIRQSQADLRFLTEAAFATAARLAGDGGDLLRVAVGTEMPFGELTALWVSDVDLAHRSVRVNKAWKRDGEDDAQETQAWLRRSPRAKHEMQGHHLGNPKTTKSRRTVTVSEEVATVLARHVEGRSRDDLLFTTPTGRPVHGADFSERVWYPLMARLRDEKVAPFGIHALRHTHVAWLVAGGAPLPHIQARLGHESITTTIDTYGHLLPVGDELIS